MVNYDKPLGLPLLTFFLWALASVIIAGVVYVFFYGGTFWHDGILQGLEFEEQKFMAIITFGICLLISGIGLLKSSPLGRWILIGLCVVGVIHGVFVAQTEFIRGLIVIAMCAGIALYLLTSAVSQAFKPMASSKAVDAIDALESYRRGKFR